MLWQFTQGNDFVYVYNSVDDVYVAARVQRRTGIYVLQARPMWLDRTCQQFI